MIEQGGFVLHWRNVGDNVGMPEAVLGHQTKLAGEGHRHASFLSALAQCTFHPLCFNVLCLKIPRILNPRGVASVQGAGGEIDKKPCWAPGERD